MARNYKLTQTGQEVQDILNKEVVYGSTSYWEALPDFVPVEGQIVVYSDYSESEPGFKVGDGTTAVGELAFLGGADKEKLAGIEDGAQVNVNADWEAESGDAQILNKPNISEWALQPEKPSYMAQEVGALPEDTELKDLPTDTGHRTVSDAEKAAWDAKSDFSGDYTDLTNKPDLSQFITRSVDDLVNYYLKNEVYTKDEVADLLAGITGGIWVPVSVLPQPSADTYGLKIYLVPSQEPATQNQKDEFITMRTGSEGNYSYDWERIGTTAIDLSEYVTNEDLQDALEDYVSTEAFQQALENYLQVPVETSWSNLVVLRNTGELQPGRLYRITDYVATTIQADTRSANHPFDIIVQALSTNTLSEDAHAALHSGDGYFAMANLNAWRLRYAIDNDSTRFAWADSTNGKGVVYRLVDEWGNDIPYDFKGIQFKRYYVASVVTGYSPALSPMIGLPIGLSSSRGLTLGTEYEWYYTFSSLGNTWSDAATDGSLNGKTVQRNKIVSNQFDSSGNRKLNNNVFAGGKVLYDYMIALDAETNLENFFHFFDNTFEGESIINNTVFGYMCLSHTQAAFRHNTVLGMMRHCEIGSTFDTNTILITKDFAFFSTKERFGNNVIRAKSIGRCSFGNYFDSNFLVISNQCSINTFGDSFQSNTLSASTVAFNRIGNYISSNTFTDVELRSCQFDGQLNNCEFSGNITSCSFKPLTSYLIVIGGTNGSRLAGVDFVGSVRGTSSSKVRIESSYFLLDSVSEIKRRITLEGDVNGKMVATWYNGGKRVGITKAPADAEWTALPEAYFKPSGGIPSTDMSSDVQTSLGKADTALQSFTETDPTVPNWAKAQNPPTEVFVATYGTTTQSEVQAAAASGKVVVCFYNNRVYTYAGESAAGYSQFTSFLYDTAFRVYLKNSSWGNASLDIPTDAVKYSSQNLSDAQKTQARTNIGAGTYSKPSDGIPASDLADGVIPDVSQFITKSVNDLVNYYTKSQTYTQAEVQALIGAISQFHYEIAASTSAVVSPASNVLYLIGPTGSGADKYEEYVYANNAWVKIGDTSIDLSGYVTTQALNTALANYTTTENLTALLAGKQDTISDLATIRSGAAAGATAYQKPSAGIPATDLADPESVFIIPINLGTLTVDSSVTYQDIVDAYNAGKVFAFSFGAVGGIIPATQYGASNGEYVINAEYIMSVSSGGIEGAYFVLQATSSALTFTMTPQGLEVPEISTNIDTNATSDDMTASPKAVKTFVEGKGYGTYSKPSGGIPASDLASGVIPDVSGYLPRSGGRMANDAVVNWNPEESVVQWDTIIDKSGISLHAGRAHFNEREVQVYDTAEGYDGGMRMDDGDLVIYEGLNEKSFGSLAQKTDIPSAYAGSPSAGGPANKALGIPFGNVDSTSTATAITATVDNFPTTLTDGVCAYIRNDIIASASGWTLNINGTGALPVYASNADATRVTTIFSAASTYLFIYNANRVAGGCWDIYYGYNSNDNTIGYNLRTNGVTAPLSGQLGRYRILFTSPGGTSLVPANTSNSTSATAAKTVNQAKIDPFGPIWYYSTTTVLASGTTVGAAYLWHQYTGITLGYSFAEGAALTLTSGDPIYLKCAPQSDGSAIIDANTPYVQTLPSTEDGKIYIFLGYATAATTMVLYYWHPVYHYADGAIRQWTNAAASGTSDEALTTSEIQTIWDNVMS